MISDLKTVEIALNSAIKSNEARESLAATPVSLKLKCNPKPKSEKAHPKTPKEEEPVDDSFRGRIGRILDNHYCHITIVALVVLDVIFVTAELLIDLNIVSSHEDSHEAASVFHYLSMSILCIFLVEYVLKLYVHRLEFFKHFMEVFDLIVVALSLALEITYHHSHSAVIGTGLIVVLRLWRVTRIINGIVMSVKIRAKEKLEVERELRKQAEADLDKVRTRLDVVEKDFKALMAAFQKTCNIPEREVMALMKVEKFSDEAF